MSITRPFAYNPGGDIANTNQSGTLVIGDIDVQDYSQNPGGVKFWMGPEEENKYVIVKSNPAQNTPTQTSAGAVGGIYATSQANPGYQTSGSDLNFMILAENASQQNFDTVTGALTYLNANSFYTNYVANSRPLTVEVTNSNGIGQLLIETQESTPRNWPLNFGSYNITAGETAYSYTWIVGAAAIYAGPLTNVIADDQGKPEALGRYDLWKNGAFLSDFDAGDTWWGASITSDSMAYTSSFVAGDEWVIRMSPRSYPNYALTLQVTGSTVGEISAYINSTGSNPGTDWLYDGGGSNPCQSNSTIQSFNWYRAAIDPGPAFRITGLTGSGVTAVIDVYENGVFQFTSAVNNNNIFFLSLLEGNNTGKYYKIGLRAN